MRLREPSITRCHQAISGDPLIRQMAAGQPYDVDELAALSGLEPVRLLPRLLDLELRGLRASRRRRSFLAVVHERASVIGKTPKQASSRKWQLKASCYRRVARQGEDSGSLPRQQIPGRGELRSYSRSSRVGCRCAEGDQGEGLGPPRCRRRQDFTPYYVVPSDKRKQVAHLKTAVKDASELLLATDPDREGESISWHLTQVLKPKVPVRRIVFHEITEDAVKEALDNPGDVNENLVRAQESRRILDRLYGYTLSPVLWKKVQTGLSAGRVQSVAVRLIVEREEERRAFRSAVYWDLEAPMKGEGREFVATLVRINDQRIATGKDFDAQTGCPQESERCVCWTRPTTQRSLKRFARTFRGPSPSSNRSRASSVRRRRSRRRR